MSPRRSQAERIRATRKSITEATIHLLAHKGYQDTTFAAISQASGVSRGGLLHHFVDKTDLLAGVFEQAIAEVSETIVDRASQLPSGSRRVELALDLLNEFFHSELFQAALAVQIAARVDVNLGDRLSAIFTGVYSLFERLAPQLFGDAVASHPELPHRIRFVMSSIRGVALLDSTDPSRPPDEETWQYVRTRLATELRRGISQRRPR
jgi:AcrR family transcriptional regulator